MKRTGLKFSIILWLNIKRRGHNSLTYLFCCFFNEPARKLQKELRPTGFSWHLAKLRQLEEVLRQKTAEARTCLINHDKWKWSSTINSKEWLEPCPYSVNPRRSTWIQPILAGILLIPGVSCPFVSSTFREVERKKLISVLSRKLIKKISQKRHIEEEVGAAEGEVLRAKCLAQKRHNVGWMTWFSEPEFATVGWK